MSGEWQADPEVRHERAEQQWNRAYVISSVLVGAVAAASYLYSAGLESGEYTALHTPTVEYIEPRLPSTELSMVSWNMHGEVLKHIRDIRALEAKYDADAIVLQEVTKKQALRLGKHFPDKYIGSVTGEALVQEPLSGGLVNVVMTDVPQKNIHTISIKADPWPRKVFYAATGLGEDVVHANRSMSRTSEGLQEKRAAVAVTLGSERDSFQVITTHTAGVDRLDKVHLKRVTQFTKRVSKRNTATVLCGDLNNSPQTTAQAFSEINYIVPYAGHTTTGSRVTTDHCAFHGDGTLHLKSYGVDYEYRTDHYPVHITVSRHHKPYPPANVEYFELPENK